MLLFFIHSYLSLTKTVDKFNSHVYDGQASIYDDDIIIDGGKASSPDKVTIRGGTHLGGGSLGPGSISGGSIDTSGPTLEPKDAHEAEYLPPMSKAYQDGFPADPLPTGTSSRFHEGEFRRKRSQYVSCAV